MSREKQIEEMTKELCDIECKGMKCDTCDGYGCEYRMQAEALYNAGYRKQEWISVDERLPKSNTAVIVATIDGIVFQCLFGYEGWDLWETNRVHITHWMPLPEPPKMKEDDRK